jgi:tetratricopeptide (TPR) repeat protein
MALHGELKNMPLPDILQSLKTNRQTGTLKLQDGKKEFYLFFDQDCITSVNPGKSSREYLVPMICLRNGISEEVMDREFKKKLKVSIAERLSKARIASATKINSLHRVYLAEFVYDVFSWQSGSFHFEDADAPDPVFDEDQRHAGLKLEIDHLLFEAMRRADEWREIGRYIPSMDDVFTLTEGYAAQLTQLEEPAKSVLTLCNGENSIKEIAYKAGQDLFTSAKVLSDALHNHAIRRVTTADLIGLAERAFGRNHHKEALRYLKRAVELDRADIDVRRRFADLCMQEGLNAEATNEYKTLAHLAREKQDYENAKIFYKQIIATNPSEYEFQKRFYEMLREIGDGGARPAGLMLSETLRRLGLRSEEVQLLRQLTEDYPEEATLVELLGDAEHALNHDKPAVEQYLQAAEIFIKQEKLPKACKVYEKVLTLNPDDTRTQKRLNKLQTGLFLKKRQQRRKVMLAVEAGAVALLIAAYGIYLGISTMSYLALRDRNLPVLGSGDYETVVAGVKQFEKRYPLSLINFDVSRYLAAVEQARQMSQAARDALAAQSAQPPVLSDSALLITCPSDSVPSVDSAVVATSDSLGSP